MMNRKKTPAAVWMLPTLLLSILCVAQSCTSEEITPDKAQTAPNTAGERTEASFPGGMQGLMAYVGENLRYPEAAKAEGVEGRVMVEFTVGKDGAVRDKKVVRSLNAECDAAAIAVFDDMPDWQPATSQGQPVDMQMVLPVMFKLN